MICKVIPLEKVNDELIAKKSLGEGFAIIPAEGNIYSPVDGKVVSIFKTKHAVGFTTNSGLEILLYLGIDTVELEGKPFNLNIKEDEKVSLGQKIGTMNINEIKTAGKDPIVLTIITSTEKLSHGINTVEENVEHGDIVIPLKLEDR